MRCCIGVVQVKQFHYWLGIVLALQLFFYLISYCGRNGASIWNIYKVERSHEKKRCSQLTFSLQGHHKQSIESSPVTKHTNNSMKYILFTVFSIICYLNLKKADHRCRFKNGPTLSTERHTITGGSSISGGRRGHGNNLRPSILASLRIVAKKVSVSKRLLLVRNVSVTSETLATCSL